MRSRLKALIHLKSSMIFSMEKLPKNKDLCDLSEKIVFSAAKKAMRFWIEPKVRGLDSFKSELTTKTKIYYALLYESTTDLVLLDLACKIHKLPTPFENKSASFFFHKKVRGLIWEKNCSESSTSNISNDGHCKKHSPRKSTSCANLFFLGTSTRERKLNRKISFLRILEKN